MIIHGGSKGSNLVIDVSKLPAALVARTSGQLFHDQQCRHEASLLPELDCDQANMPIAMPLLS